jgi:hypothetical protein
MGVSLLVHMNEGMAPELRLLIDREHIAEGLLYAHLPLGAVSDDDRAQLLNLGWTLRPYRDRPVLQPPEATFAWDRHHRLFRDNLRHAAAHRLPEGLPFAGANEAILDELIASVWEERTEELRTVLSAFSFASVWRAAGDDGEELPPSLHAAEEALAAGVAPAEERTVVPVEGFEDSADGSGTPAARMEGSEVFFFYTRSMRRAAVQALTETVRSPDDDDPVWQLVESLR